MNRWWVPALVGVGLIGSGAHSVAQYIGWLDPPSLESAVLAHAAAAISFGMTFLIQTKAIFLWKDAYMKAVKSFDRMADLTLRSAMGRISERFGDHYD